MPRFRFPFFVFGNNTGSAQEAAAPTTRLEQYAKNLSLPGGAKISANHVAATDFIQRLYAARNYAPVWQDANNIAALQKAIAESWTDGLQSADFHETIVGTAPARKSDAQLDPAQRDILLTDALVRLLYQLYFGKVSPDRLDAHWNFKRHLPSGEPVAIINQAINAGKVSSLFAQARLEHPYYTRLREALKTYIDYQLKGGWPGVAQGPVLKPGDKNVRVAQLRKRLAVTGEYFDTPPTEPDVFDDALKNAVKVFQHNNDIDVDGIVGPGTLKALNITAQQRISQIRANLERARWAIRALLDKKDLLIVNIAGYYLRLFLDDTPVWQTAVITGKPYHKTPVFTGDMQYIVLNPDWGVPRSIIRNEIFAKAKADPSYLTARNFALISSSGAIVNPQAVDWSSYTAKNFPYRVTQRPGDNNALGKVKFIFPNKFSVYLHDTPARQLFSKTQRAFSHGCIRVQDPLKLAELILAHDKKLTRNQIDKIVSSRKQKQINLDVPLTVAVLYWTVDPGFDGTVRFYNDVYKRDAQLIKALNAQFQIPTARK